MEKSRYEQLSRNLDESLTDKEVQDGWRFCCEWDGLLIHSSHPEAECCRCLRDERAEYRYQGK